MAQFKDSGSASLQELIDSYNDEIMRYSRMAQPQSSGGDERTQGEIMREQGEFDIERAATERRFWQTEGKQGLQRTATEREVAEIQREQGEFEIERGITERRFWNGEGTQGMQTPSAGRNNRPEPNEPLYPPHSHMPRPEPNEPLERPDGMPKYGNTGFRSIAAAASSGRAVSSDTAAPDSNRTAAPQEQWVLDLQQGLRDLERGLQELAEGQRQLREGQLAYEQGIAERDRWRNMQQNMVTSATANAMNVQNSVYSVQSAPQNAQNQSFVRSPAPLSEKNENFSASDGKIFPSRTGQITPADEALPELPEYPTARGDQSIAADGSGMGYLQVIVYTARQASPISGARVTVFRPSAKGDILISSGETNDDGKTPLLSLPAGTASGGGFAAPFSLYNVSVTAEGYMPRNYLPAQIFDGITAVLPVEMIPLPDFSQNGM